MNLPGFELKTHRLFILIRRVNYSCTTDATFGDKALRIVVRFTSLTPCGRRGWVSLSLMRLLLCAQPRVTETNRCRVLNPWSTFCGIFNIAQRHSSRPLHHQWNPCKQLRKSIAVSSCVNIARQQMQDAAYSWVID